MAKFYYRRPPCPGYDFVGIEGWLEKMAAKGMHLCGQGYVFGFFQFHKGGSAEVKFRLEANPKQSPLDLKPLEDPEPEALALYEDFGWEYWGQYREFYIYRSADPNARELNTDPVVQAIGLDNVRKRTGFFLGLFVAMLVGTLLGFSGGAAIQKLGRDATEQALRHELMVMILLFGGFYLLSDRKNNKIADFLSKCCVLFLYARMVLTQYRMANTITPLLDILDRGWLWWLAFGGVYLSLLAASLISYVHICRLQRRLRQGQIPERTKKPSLWRIVPEVLPFVMLIFLSLTPSLGGQPDRGIPIEEFSGDLPFPTLVQLTPEREYIPRGEGSVHYWEDSLSPVNYRWWEEAWLDGADGSRYGGALGITYHEARNEAIAKRLVIEYSSQVQPDPELIPEDVDIEYFDDLVISREIHPIILIRKGNTVIHAFCAVQSWGDHENLYPLWLDQMTRQLIGKE